MTVVVVLPEALVLLAGEELITGAAVEGMMRLTLSPPPPLLLLQLLAVGAARAVPTEAALELVAVA